MYFHILDYGDFNIHPSIVTSHHKNVKVLVSADKPTGPPHHKRTTFKDKLCIFHDTKIISSNNFEISGSSPARYLCKRRFSPVMKENNPLPR